MKRLAILGSTGSIGCQTLEVVRAFPKDLQVVGLGAGNNLDLLARQIQEFRPHLVSCASAPAKGLVPLESGCRWVSAEEMAAHPDVDLVVMATVGRAGLAPTLAAIAAHKPIALANKEVLVMAGEVISREAQRRGAPLLPIDSEASAIWQCLKGESQEVRRILLTASGGAFRGRSPQELERVTPQEALQHPTWKMGKKVTVDSATLMNKAFEVMEIHWLFGVPWEKIQVVIHPQSIIHSLVEFADGSVKAQLSPPDMRLPIQHALFYPERRTNPSLLRFDPLASSPLTFEPLAPERYPCFTLALEAAKRGGAWPAVLAAADEVAVDLFLAGRVGFLDIYRLVAEVLERHKPVENPSLDDLLAADAWARETAFAGER